MHRIVCAANRCKQTDQIVLGIRHHDSIMNQAISDMQLLQDITDWLGPVPFEDQAEQGFIDAGGFFLNRTGAWKRAEQFGQIIRRVGGDTADGGTLYSENLY